MPWNEQLEGPALAIAGYDGSPLRVAAGPGTGKTYALTRRVQRLLEEGETPSSILVVTFTRTAAIDLRKALETMGTPGVGQIFAGTLHSYCFGLLNSHGVIESTGRVARPLMKFEERFLEEDLKNSTNHTVSQVRDLIMAFEAAWARRQSDDLGWPHDPTEQRFQSALMAWLHAHKAMLIGELIPLALDFLQDNPVYRAGLGIRHVFVDEYQDLNKAEQSLVWELALGGSLTIIGNRDQSIYSFRYAHPEGIVDFARDHRGTHDERLDICRRCPTQVVDIANSLIANNARDADDAVLQAHASNPPGVVQIAQWGSLDDEVAGISRVIVEAVQAGEVAPGRVLVLAPRRQIGYAIRDTLVDAGIPAHSFFSEQALDGDPKDLAKCGSQQSMTLLELLVDPADAVALRSFAGYGSPSLRSNAWTRALSLAGDLNVDIATALAAVAAGTSHLTNSGPLLARFEEASARVAELRDLRGRLLLEALFPSTEDWGLPFHEMGLVEPDEETTPQQLLDRLRTAIIQPEMPTETEYVRVMTPHKSKGLTADFVVVVGCVNGLMPWFDSSESPPAAARRLEEQRRLFYVAITRTRQRLLLSAPTQVPLADTYQMSVQIARRRGPYAQLVMSRFIGELGGAAPHPVPGASLFR